jgi:hypothetical protein
MMGFKFFKQDILKNDYGRLLLKLPSFAAISSLVTVFSCSR